MADIDRKFPGFSRDTLDDAIVNPDVCAEEDEIHALYTLLRTEDPVTGHSLRAFALSGR